MTLTYEQNRVITTIKQQTGCRFASFTYCPKSTGGKFRYTLLLGTNYSETVRKSIRLLKNLGFITGISPECFLIAKNEMLDSLSHSLTGNNPQYTKAGLYVHLGNGVNLHSEDLTIELTGLVQTTVELSPALRQRRQPVSPKAIAKSKIRKILPIGKFRSFRLELDSLKSVRVNGNTVEL